MTTFRRFLVADSACWSGAYDPRPWWQRELWDPTVEPRIPLRPHEPMGRYAVRFDRIAHLVAAARLAVALQGGPGDRGR